ncbi:phosphoethanolamine--lipid A transferase [Caenimonas sedimenti]|uniref:Phosphoethanolamine--lipid A transferase n=1 Tax=Caenimonas sedimenti TaxID=2596921 RepID=A0A562ZQA6_9BURK|nr:phosphoethanolamine--lipid A transferase [Caenimonas sedimenti]TWO70772.1 phosphoethanolamine--lipid A transferase [Caenimonas sedimenti]
MTQPRPRRPLQLVLGTSAWLATAANVPLWTELSRLGLLERPGGWWLALAFAAAMGGTLVALLSLLAWRWTLKPALLLVLATAAAGAYFMQAYGVVIDAGMVRSALETDRGEAGALWTPALLLTFAVLAGTPAAWILWRPAAYAPVPQQALRNLGVAALGLLVAALVVFASFQPLASTMRNHKPLRYLLNPLNTLYAFGHVAAQPWRRDRTRIQSIGTDARLLDASGPPVLLVLVLGETGRSGNFGVNGYARDTTPELAAAGVASWRNAWSCGTSTAESVPCMFSHLGKEAFEARNNDHENLLDVLQRAGLAVLWLDNQSGCKGVCDRVASANTSHASHPTLCPQGECLDEVLLDGLDARLAALPAERSARGVVLVLHQMGSHGPDYAARSPTAFKRFLPECRSVQLQDCTRDQLRNAYDNSIAYTDHVLGTTIRWLKRRDDYAGAMVYVADHGESLGENNLYLHGMPYAIAPDVQKHVPWITWLSPAFEQRSGMTTECLRAHAAARVTHDHYFHSVLGLVQVGTADYRRPLDAYAGCASH